MDPYDKRFICMYGCARVCLCVRALTVNQESVETRVGNFSNSFKMIIGRTVSSVIHIGIDRKSVV